MPYFFKVFIVALVCIAASHANLSAQAITIKGRIQDTLSQETVPGVELRTLSQSVFTNSTGEFTLQMPKGSSGSIVISVVKPGYRTKDLLIELGQENQYDLGLISLLPQESTDQMAAEDIIPTVTLSSDESQTLGTENVSGILTASRDIFFSVAAFNFGAARFQIRGYESDNTQVFLNGVAVNDPETGGVYWGAWGGLNDVTRSTNNSIGLAPTEYAFGGIGGASSIDTRAGSQRKQLRVSYAISNRTYRNRLMATWSSGLLKGGWSVSLSGSRRWGQEGYVPGTFYDAWAYFASVDKKINDSHSLNFTFFGAPTRRGKTGAATQEMYDLAGTNFYNPNWGYQNGEKRNAQIADTHQPMGILRHDWEISGKTRLTTAASYIFGRDGDTALDWYNARDPRPDYYRRLPSYIDNEQATEVEQLLRENEALRQVNWDYMYRANYNNSETIANANGIEGNNVTGRRSQYIVEDRRVDRQSFSANTILETELSKRISLQGGLNYLWFRSHNYKLVDDLLGGDFYLDVDKFAEFSNVSDDPDFVQNDITIPNRLIKEGDVFGYDYDNHARRAGAWAQTKITLKKFDFFAAAQGARVSYWRDGKVANGKFPNTSKGESQHVSFTEYGGKAGITYKLDGRNFLLVNGGYLSRAPFMRNTLVAPRTRNDIVPGLTNEKILSIEGGYLLKAPYLKARAIGYFTRFQDQIYTRSFYLDNAIITDDGVEGGFVNYIMNGIQAQHIGAELAAEVNVAAGLRINAVAALGQHIYINRPNVTVYLDQQAARLADHPVYIKNFYVTNGPQKAYSVGINYSAKQFWFVNLNFNYFDDIWIDFFPERRTSEAVSLVSNPVYSDQIIQPGSAQWNQIINQEKAPSAYTLDFFGGKSWKIDNIFLYLNIGVNNILDKKDFVIGGYEQFRFDFATKDVNKFPNRYFYGYGRNYFVSLAVRM